MRFHSKQASKRNLIEYDFSDALMLAASTKKSAAAAEAALISSVKSKISKKGEEEGYIDGVLSINFINRSSSLIHQH